jgi:hypothetical protein
MVFHQFILTNYVNRNGHLINGVYTFIQGYGFKFLTEDEKSTIKDSSY